MKKLISILCLLTVLSASLFGCAGQGDVPADEAEPIVFTVSRYADYIASQPDDLYELADLVVEGVFGEELGTRIGDAELPITKTVFQVTDVHKGDVETKDLSVEYYGGAVPLSSYLEVLTEEQILKRGMDLSAEEVAQATVVLEKNDESVSINPGDKYVLFLSYDSEADTYFILCDGYGACKLSDEGMYSIAENAYVPITE